MLPLLFRPFRCFCLLHNHWNVSPTDQWCHLAKPIWILIGLRENFASAMRKMLNWSQIFLLRKFSPRNLCEMSLRMPVTYFGRTFSHFAEFFSLEIGLNCRWFSSEVFGVVCAMTNPNIQNTKHDESGYFCKF